MKILVQRPLKLVRMTNFKGEENFISLAQFQRIWHFRHFSSEKWFGPEGLGFELSYQCKNMIISTQKRSRNCCESRPYRFFNRMYKHVSLVKL